MTYKAEVGGSKEVCDVVGPGVRVRGQAEVQAMLQAGS